MHKHALLHQSWSLLASASVTAYAHVQFGVYLDFSMLPCLRLGGTRTTTVNLARRNYMLAELYCRGGLEGDCLTTGRLIHAAQSAVRSFHSPHKASGYEVGRSLSCSGRQYRALCQRGTWCPPFIGDPVPVVHKTFGGIEITSHGYVVLHWLCLFLVDLCCACTTARAAQLHLPPVPNLRA
jgi:hypothetical protein